LKDGGYGADEEAWFFFLSKSAEDFQSFFADFRRKVDGVSGKDIPSRKVKDFVFF
jgi:hypothetical protein